MAQTDTQVFDDLSSTQDVQRRGLTPLDVLIAVRRRWWALLSVATVVLGVGIWRTVHETRIYTAFATVRVQQYRPPIAGMGGAQGFDYRIDNLLSEQEVIRSRLMGERVARDLGLQVRIGTPGIRRSQIFESVWPQVDSTREPGVLLLRFAERDYTMSTDSARFGPVPYGTSLSGAGVTVQVDRKPDIEQSEIPLVIVPLRDAASEATQGLATRTRQNTNIIEISLTGPDPRLVRDIANSTARAYALNSAEVAQQNAKAKSRFILRSIAETEPRLKAAQSEIKEFKQREQLVDADAEALALSSTIHGFETLKEQYLVEQKVYERLLGKMTQADTVDDELQKLAGTEAIAKNQHIQDLYHRWFELLKERDIAVAAGKTDRNADVMAIDKQISRTKGDLGAASRHYLQQLSSRLESLDRSVADLRKKAERFPSLQAEQDRYQSEVRTLQHSLDELLSAYNMARIAESADAGNVQLLDEAHLPSFPISPNRRRAVMYSLVIGLILGVALALLLERLDDSVKSPDDLRVKMDLTILGLIPAIRTNDIGSDGVPTSSLGRLVAHADPRSPVAEAYRALRTNLAFARAHDAVQAIAVVSPAPADGKSTTVANLAITFAQQSQRTLLIDADLRRAVLDKTFGVPRSPGLTDVLIGSVALVDAVSPTQVPNLFVMGSGQFPPNPSELLGSAAMRQAVIEAKKHFDVVLFDTPPLLAVTDAAVLSTMVDGTILVVRTGATAKEAVRRAVTQLRTVTSRVLGAVLNDVSSRGGSYYGGYGYYYYAYYGHEGNGNGKKTSPLMRRFRQLTGRSPARIG